MPHPLDYATRASGSVSRRDHPIIGCLLPAAAGAVSVLPVLMQRFGLLGVVCLFIGTLVTLVGLLLSAAHAIANPGERARFFGCIAANGAVLAIQLLIAVDLVSNLIM